jgi:uncharacterized protein YyaL (SSP411 family)
MTRRPNRLASQTSPYLLQHAHNPVDWYPWGDEAFARARDLDRPVFLSVGYAACHWCHVMERESFEDVATARFLNDRFVSVKVDREERPDVDGIYMDAVQAMTGQGGWPMSVWLTPDGRPFYAGTYFPDEPRHGMPSFRQVLEALAEAWATRRDEIEHQGERVAASLAAAGSLAPSPEPVDRELVDRAFAELRRSFDPRWGGFGGAPKFPQPMVLEFVLRMAARGAADALDIATTTLDRMAAGGIRDQVGGGFARYSTDVAWHVPHFEKMLYDNAQLARVYTQAWLLTRSDRHREVARSTLDHLVAEMQHPEGGFFSSQDADSEGVEGRFFTWTWDELVSLVGERVAVAFGASPRGNWEGTNVLWMPPRSDAEGDPPSHDELEDARATLMAVRSARVHPGTDDKVLTAWNALAIRAFAEAGRAFADAGYVDAAERSATFVWEHLRDGSGRLLRSWRDGRPGHPGFADDHALLSGAFLTLYETTGDETWFARAREVGDALVGLFHDPERGGFFQTGADAETLVVRPKEVQDTATPSGNSAAVETLLRLTHLSGDAAYERAAVSALLLVRDLLGQVPVGFGLALCGADLYVGPTREVAVIGEDDDPSTRALVDEVVRTRWVPNVVLATSPPDRVGTSEVALLADRPLVDGRPTAYVCERFLCRSPVTDPADLAALL